MFQGDSIVTITLPPYMLSLEGTSVGINTLLLVTSVHYFLDRLSLSPLIRHADYNFVESAR